MSSSGSSFSLPSNHGVKRGSVAIGAASSITGSGFMQSPSSNKFHHSRTQSERIRRKRSSVSAGGILRNPSLAWSLKYKDFVFTLSDYGSDKKGKSEKFRPIFDALISNKRLFKIATQFIEVHQIIKPIGTGGIHRASKLFCVGNLVEILPLTTAFGRRKLVDKANDWLKENCEVRVRNCETLTWMSHDPLRLGDSEQMVLTKRLTDGTYTYFARGLRLWLISTPFSTNNRPQTLHFEDFLPSKNDHISHLVEHVNKRIAHRHITGDVLSVETLGVPKIKMRPQSQATFWSELVDDDAPYVFALRVFYCRLLPPPTKPTPLIGVKDMIPMPTEDGYEGFEALTDRTNAWLKDQPIGTVLINMQSVMVQQQEGVRHADIGSKCHYAMPGINNPDPLEFFRILRVYYTRPLGSTTSGPHSIAAVVRNASSAATSFAVSASTDAQSNASTSGLNMERSPAASTSGERRFSFPAIAEGSRDDEEQSAGSSGNNRSPSKAVPQQQSTTAIVCYETFTPELVRELNEEESANGSGNVANIERMERMRETFAKVIAFIRSTGAEVICAETVMNPMQLYNSDQQFESDDEIKFLFTIRLFLSGPIGHYVNCSRLVRRLSSVVNIGGDQLLGRDRKSPKRQSSPLFLASVVNRRFKYRWLVLALSAFTCMAIIATLSVVYSNKW